MKTLSQANFGGRRTITRVPIVDPGASNELDDFLGPSISEFSHGLGRKRTLPVRSIPGYYTPCWALSASYTDFGAVP